MISNDKLPDLDIIFNQKRKNFGSISGGNSNKIRKIGYTLSFRIRNKSDINVCLESIKISNELLGNGSIENINPRLSRLPFNVGPRKTEGVELHIAFPNEVDLNQKGKDMKLEVEFEFADRTIKEEIIGYL